MQPEDDDDTPDWQEVEPEEEKEARGGVLGGTAPVARVVFAVILIALLVGTVFALRDFWREWFGG